MKFIKPKEPLSINPEWKVSKKIKLIISYYSEYSGYSESEVVDMFLENLLFDKNFSEWLNNKRSKKKIESILVKSLNDINGYEPDITTKTFDENPDSLTPDTVEPNSIKENSKNNSSQDVPLVLSAEDLPF